MSSSVLDFKDIDKTIPIDARIRLVGGKGANLGELSAIEGISVPDGFCISTEAFKRIIGETPPLNGMLDQLALLKVEDRDKIGELSSEIRRVIEGIAIPKDINEEITRHLSGFDGENAYAIRSSATAEDLPAASFAGQHDTYLNIIGKASILKHIGKCWASLYNERAVIYRLQNGVDHRRVHMSVVVQKMVFPQAAGIMFTADPVTSDRKVLSVDAGFGLGEAIVSGLVNADNYKVRNDKVIGKQISAKHLLVYALKDGGTATRQIDHDQQMIQTLTVQQILQLARLGRKIEAYFGSPRDIEWCLADDTFYFVQSRPITGLYPIPEAGDEENHVFISVGHQQMMTDPIKPLGLSFFLLTTPAPMSEAGGRLFVDITRHLASDEGRKKIIEAMGQFDPLLKDALRTIVRRKFIRSSPVKVQSGGFIDKVLPWSYLAQFENNPAIVSDLIKLNQISLEELKQNIQTRSRTDLLDFILEDIRQLKKNIFEPRNMEVVKIGMYASTWINKKMMKWLGERNTADTLSQSVPNNITSEMGLALLDVADVMRPHPEIIDYLHRVVETLHATSPHAKETLHATSLHDDLVNLDGGRESLDAVSAFLNKYGMRCAGEIDITRSRWSEKPATLLPMILSNIKNFEPDAGKQKFEQGRREALKKEKELLDRLEQLRGGKRKARETKRMIGLLRNFMGYREYPKYGMINRYFVYRQALLKEAGRLVQGRVIHEKEDIYYLTFEELREVVSTNELDHRIISQRRDEYRLYEKLSPPRVITSDGEIIKGEYKRQDLHAGALAGLAVSSGVAEGRARVILNMEDADLEEGDILVTSFTDPGWTALFVSIKGLVTEVGGLMTHGAVIAREYGLPAVVAVENATRLIKDGQRIRVNGTEGYVEII